MYSDLLRKWITWKPWSGSVWIHWIRLCHYVPSGTPPVHIKRNHGSWYSQWKSFGAIASWWPHVLRRYLYWVYCLHCSSSGFTWISMLHDCPPTNFSQVANWRPFSHLVKILLTYEDALPMIYPWFTYDLPMIYLWFTHDLPYDFPFHGDFSIANSSMLQRRQSPPSRPADEDQLLSLALRQDLNTRNTNVIHVIKMWCI